MPDSFEGAILELSVQGIFLFGPDFRVQTTLSAECKRIFAGDIVGQDVAALLFGNQDAAEDFRQGLNLVFDGSTKPEVVFDLLESEMELAQRTFHVDYRLISAKQVMVLLTDITRERRFQEISRREMERRFLVLKAVTHRRYFSSFMNEASRLFDLLSLLESGDIPAEELVELGRHLHTFKGNSAFFDFFRTSTAAHNFESRLEEARILGTAPAIKEQSLEIKKAYFQELNYISSILGQRWLGESDGVNIPKRDFFIIEAWIRKHHSSDKRLARTLLNYRREPFRELFVRFPELAASLAERLGKRLHPVIIEGGDFLVIPDRYSALVDTMVHLIRNAVDHGIEPPHVREAAGKDSAGTIRITLERTPIQTCIRVSDDGFGVDLARIRDRALAQGLISPALASSEVHVMQVLFHQGFSTNDTTTEISGRGIGLSALKAELDRMGGTIQVHSRPGRGTTFEISLANSRKGAS